MFSLAPNPSALAPLVAVSLFWYESQLRKRLFFPDPNRDLFRLGLGQGHDALPQGHIGHLLRKCRDHAHQKRG